MTCGDRLICSSLQCAHTKTLSPPQHIAIKMPLERGSVGRALLGRTGHRLWGTWTVCASPARFDNVRVKYLAPARCWGLCFHCALTLPERAVSYPMVLSCHCRAAASLPPASSGVVVARPPNGQLVENSASTIKAVGAFFYLDATSVDANPPRLAMQWHNPVLHNAQESAMEFKPT